MASPFNETAFSSGEITPSLFGHVDLARFKTGAATMRNMLVSYRGGAYSRAGTAFVGFSMQTGRAYPPRLIPFQFSLSQGLALEFGNQYMRVIYQGAYVTETAVQLTNITNAVPAKLSTSGASGAQVVTPNDGGVYASYAPGDVSTLAGGTYTQPAKVLISSTTLIALALNNPGGGYAPNDTLALSGGKQTSPVSLSVTTTQVVSATVANGGTGGTNGTATVTGTTGTGTPFQASVTISGGAISAVNSISVAGSYTANPINPSAEPVTGGGLAGATLNLSIGILTFGIAAGGTFTNNSRYGSFTQASTSGSGTGATFQQGLFAPGAVTLQQAGVYTMFPPNPVSEASTTGNGAGATYTVTAGAASHFSVGDWVYITGVGGMTQVNGRIFVLGPGLTLTDVYGNPIDSTAYGAYSGGGSASRIYTLTTPYSEADLPYLKYTQSADVMSLTCVNQQTQTEYPPLDLARITDSSWTLSSIEQTPIQAPFQKALSISAAYVPTGSYITYSTFYAYVVTSVDPTTGAESIASNVVYLQSYDISQTQGAVTISWQVVPGINQYNIYKATPVQAAYPPPGTLFGYIGTSFGSQFSDTNLIADFSQVPPTHVNPFARGAIQSATLITGGSKYGSILPSVQINSPTGEGAFILPVIPSGSVTAFIVQEDGEGYTPADTMTVVPGPNSGSGATGSLVVGPTTGTYPGVVAYFQERRFYAATLNQPDTYFASKPGDYTNFDVRIPTIDSDAITGTPWAVNVNGIQFMVPMPGGLVVLTGNRAWQLTGQGGSSLSPQPITPSTQQAQPQAYNGCSATVPPIQIDYDILYVQAKGSIYRDLSYNFYTNIYTGSDLTLSSSHLFTGYSIKEHAYCEEPYKVIWSVRNDGVLLSLTYVKPEQVAGWARHDTHGSFQSVCAITEPPVDALYLAVQRFNGAAYTIERMDNRIWGGVESVWAVDCGISVPLPQPNATVTASSATGLGAITGATNLIGGTGYSAETTATVVDNRGQGPGAGAAPTLTITNGVITAIAFPAGAQGTGYVNPALVINDPSGEGSGASASLTLSNAATFTTSAPVFTPSSIGAFLRMGGGLVVITAVASSTSATGNILSPIVDVVRDASGAVPRPQVAGAWSLATPTQTVGGLQHLAGNYVTGLADGQVIPPSLVSSTGTIQLTAAATAITIGLGFQCQFQSTYLDTGEPTTQGQRKKIGNVTARLEASLGAKIGTNQPDGSTLSPPQLAPAWSGLSPTFDQSNDIPIRYRMPYNGIAQPLVTADIRVPVFGGFDTRGQVALEQDYPLPMQVLSLIPEGLLGDTPEQMARPKQQAQRAR